MRGHMWLNKVASVLGPLVDFADSGYDWYFMLSLF